MKTECSSKTYKFQSLNRKEIVGAFNGGMISSDAGGIQLREFEKSHSILKRFAECFTDYRDEELIEHTVLELVSQRVYGLALGYEDLNDHDDLRHDPLMAILVGKEDPTGQDRERERDKGKALAGKSTLNRLELTGPDANRDSRYKKIYLDIEKADRFFVDVFLRMHDTPPEKIILDLDATDDPIHGEQEGRFFHGYYMEYCYLPLYIFCGDHLLCARLRQSNIDASAGSVEELDRIVKQIRESWPEVRITIRGDSGFCREEIMSWCESNGVDFILGLAKNSRLEEIIREELEEAERMFRETKNASRVYKDFVYRTRNSWSRERRVIGKAEYLAKGANPRFVVTSLAPEKVDARTLYEKDYCARGEMENRIKEQQMCLFADRTSCTKMLANQIRLIFSSVAYVLMSCFRLLCLGGTELARSQCDTIRLKLFKIGGLIKISVRRILISFASGYPYEGIFTAAYDSISRASPMTA